MGRFNFKDVDDFDKVKVDAEEVYSSIGEAYCPYFKEKIAFNAKGLRHLKFKSDKVARSLDDQYARLKLIKYAPLILHDSKTLQGIRESRQFEAQKTNSRWESVLHEVTFYEFIAVLENVRIKVIVKRVSDNPRYFWSVMPYWRIDMKNNRRILHNMESDEG